MKNLLKKFRENKKGFTLAELLVVVAIVCILVAISIPVFTAQLGKAREATNLANMRAAKAAAVSEYLTDDTKNVGSTANYAYDVKTGVIDDKDATAGSTEVKLDGTGVSKTTVYDEIIVTITGDANAVNDASVKLTVN